MASQLIKSKIRAFTMVVIIMAIVIIALSSFNINNEKHEFNQLQNEIKENKPTFLPSKRVNRFLAEKNNGYNHRGRSLKPADHCHKDNEICDIMYGKNSTCCGNKCYDLTIDKNNCGACHNKCKFTYDCCNGKCVDKAYDKRHCGTCNNKCLEGQYCVYGMCDYA